MSEDTPEKVRNLAYSLALHDWCLTANLCCEALEHYAKLLEHVVDARKQGWNDGHASRDIEIAGRDAEIAALKARVTFLEGTLKSILDHINRGNAPERYAGMTDFGISQDRGMTISFIKSLAEEALR